MKKKEDKIITPEGKKGTKTRSKQKLHYYPYKTCKTKNGEAHWQT